MADSEENPNISSDLLNSFNNTLEKEFLDELSEQSDSIKK